MVASLIRFPRPLLISLLALAALAVWAARPATAHPHVWVETVTTFVFEDGMLVGVRQNWRFDPLYSGFVIGDQDRDGDGRLDTEEEARALDKAFSGLDEVGHFTHLFVDGEEVAIEQVHDRRVTLDDDIVEYAFTVRLPDPVDPETTPVMVGAYDESYYVDLVGHEIDPVRFSGIAGGTCHFAILEDAIEPIYYGLIVPPMVGLRCGTS